MKAFRGRERQDQLQQLLERLGTWAPQSALAICGVGPKLRRPKLDQFKLGAATRGSCVARAGARNASASRTRMACCPRDSADVGRSSQLERLRSPCNKLVKDAPLPYRIFCRLGIATRRCSSSWQDWSMICELGTRTGRGSLVGVHSTAPNLTKTGALTHQVTCHLWCDEGRATCQVGPWLSRSPEARVWQTF